ncbi:MAG: hypothetical protein OEY86_13055 [Nitrospira sp.]|nr:hypothetical protein [Nitrospira sp.]
MSTSAAIADPLLRQACGRRARPSVPRRTARVRLRTSGLRAPLSRRGLAISSLDDARDPEPVERATNCHE